MSTMDRPTYYKTEIHSSWGTYDIKMQQVLDRFVISYDITDPVEEVLQ